MKKRTLVRIGGLALVLSLISTGLLSTTLAKYTTTVTGSGTAVVAAWSFKANNQSASMAEISLSDTLEGVTDKLAPKRLAPGTNGSFNIVIDGQGSETSIEYTISFNGIDEGEIPTNLKFYSDSTCNNEYEFEGSLVGFQNGRYIKDTIEIDGSSKTIDAPITEKIYWKWPYETGTTPEEIVAGDTADTADQDSEVTFDITVTGTQVDPTTP